MISFCKHYGYGALWCCEKFQERVPALGVNWILNNKFTENFHGGALLYTPTHYLALLCVSMNSLEITKIKTNHVLQLSCKFTKHQKARRQWMNVAKTLLSPLVTFQTQNMISVLEQKNLNKVKPKIWRLRKWTKNL